MRKPTPRTTTTVILPDTMSKEDQQKLLQAILKDQREKEKQEQRDYEIYEKGRRSGGGFFGGLF